MGSLLDKVIVDYIADKSGGFSPTFCEFLLNILSLESLRPKTMLKTIKRPESNRKLTNLKVDLRPGSFMRLV